MCCVGCLAVAEMLEAQGLSDWYRHREGPTGVQPERVPDVLEKLAWLEADAIGLERSARSSPSDPDVRELTLLVTGLGCAACVWLIERHLERLAGIVSARVDLVSHRLRLAWRPRQVGLEDVIVRLAQIGFGARPDHADAASGIERDENRAALIRLGVSGLGAMNVMTYAVALYAGAFEGMEEGSRSLFRWLSLIVTTPVVVIGARPFFVGALRDLRFGRPGMDVPVALAIGGAFVVSGWATFRGEGEVYFDSACMFTFFLGLGRYLEMRARHHSASLSRRLIEAVPGLARRVEAGQERLVSAAELAVGDHLIVRPGEALPADARVLEGRSDVEEALLTGEPWPRAIGPGDDLIAGSLNTTTAIRVEALRVGSDTTLAAVLAAIDRARSEKPEIARIADRVAVVFVTIVLALAFATAIVWGIQAPERAVWTTLAVLIATCPCALSLATPAALASATHGLAGAGLLVTRGHVLEGLASADRVVLDKTGTLTRGEPGLIEIVPLREGSSRARCLRLARGLEQHSEHPLARAVMNARDDEGAPLEPAVSPAENASFAGLGVEARRNGLRTRIGRPAWVAELAGDCEAPPDVPDRRGMHSWVLLGDEQGAIAWLGFGDEIRKGARDALDALRARGLELEMLSGDPSASAAQLAHELGLEVVCPAATPDQKVERIRRLQRAGQRVIVVGDGVNDAPVLAVAGTSIAMGSGADWTRLGADSILMRDDLTLLPRAIAWSRRTRRVIRQNLAWAAGYNLIALPLALSGQLAPWLAAAGMSASSLVVVSNAMRLHRAPRPSSAPRDARPGSPRPEGPR